MEGPDVARPDGDGATRGGAQIGRESEPRGQTESAQGLGDAMNAEEREADIQTQANPSNPKRLGEEDLTWAAVFGPGESRGPVQSRSSRLTEGGSTGGTMLAEAVEIGLHGGGETGMSQIFKPNGSAALPNTQTP